MSSETATMNETSTPVNLVIKPAKCTTLKFIVECDSQIVKVCPDYVKFKNMCNNSINSTYFNSKRIQFIKITSETFLTCVCREQNCIHGYKSQRYNEKATKIIKALTTDNDPTQNIWITGDCVFTLSAGFMTAQHFESTTIGLKYETSESNVSYIFGSNIYA